MDDARREVSDFGARSARAHTPAGAQIYTPIHIEAHDIDQIHKTENFANPYTIQKADMHEAHGTRNLPTHTLSSRTFGIQMLSLLPESLPDAAPRDPRPDGAALGLQKEGVSRACLEA